MGDGAEGRAADASAVAEPELVSPAPLLAGLFVPSFCLSEWAEPPGDAAFSSTIVTPVVAERETEPVEMVGGESFEVDATPVLARFGCFCCSLSEGERDRLRFESAISPI